MTEPEDPIGAVLDGKYRIDRLLGRGAMGSVYAARHLGLDRAVAVKILRPELVADGEAAARFAREARASARLQHPNAVHVYDYGTEGGRSYLVMEMLEGESLRSVMRTGRALEPPLILELVRQAAAAIAAAHAEGVIHRDVKPENMMVRAGADGRPQLKVVDFGLAKLLEAADATQLTGPATLMGTPKYMAPELFTGDEVDERVDVYALGVVLYEMVAGHAPFEGTFSEIIGKHLHMDPPPVSGLRPDLPEAVESAIMRALAKSPADRTPSAAALALELAEALGDERAVLPPILAPDELGRAATLAPANFLEARSPTDGGVPIAPDLAETMPPARLGARAALDGVDEETRVRARADPAPRAAPLRIAVPGPADGRAPEAPQGVASRRPGVAIWGLAGAWPARWVAVAGVVALAVLAGVLAWMLRDWPADGDAGAPGAVMDTDAGPAAESPEPGEPAERAPSPAGSRRRTPARDGGPAPGPGGPEAPARDVEKFAEREREARKKDEERLREAQKKFEERQREAGKKREERGRKKGKRE